MGSTTSAASFWHLRRWAGDGEAVQRVGGGSAAKRRPRADPRQLWGALPQGDRRSGPATAVAARSGGGAASRRWGGGAAARRRVVFFFFLYFL